jgi:hypothetical protein
MFKYIVTAAVALLATPAFGQQQDICGDIGQLAQELLTQRYDGVPMSQQIALINDTVEPGAVYDLIRVVISQAYNEPLDRRARDSHVAAFRNRWEVACYEAKGDMT